MQTVRMWNNNTANSFSPFHHTKSTAVTLHDGVLMFKTFLYKYKRLTSHIVKSRKNICPLQIH